MALLRRKLQQPEVVVHDVVQGSEEWFQLHLGVPSAGKFSAVVASGRNDDDSLTRADYLRALAGETITGLVSETRFVDRPAMKRGLKWEPEARDWYARSRFVEVNEIGFVTRRLPSGRWIGCSPDGVVEGWRKAIEIKTCRADLLIKMSDKPVFPSKYKAQCQGILHVCEPLGLQSIDLIIYSRGMPYQIVFTCQRDEAYISDLADSLEVFDWELHRLVESELAKFKWTPGF